MKQTNKKKSKSIQMKLGFIDFGKRNNTNCQTKNNKKRTEK